MKLSKFFYSSLSSGCRPIHAHLVIQFSVICVSDIITEAGVCSKFHLNNEGCTMRMFNVITEECVVSFSLIMKGVQCACLMLLLKCV